MANPVKTGDAKLWAYPHQLMEMAARPPNSLYAIIDSDGYFVWALLSSRPIFVNTLGRFETTMANPVKTGDAKLWAYPHLLVEMAARPPNSNHSFFDI